MFKKLIVLAICLLPLAVFAQTFKFGNINTAELIELMPEKATITKELEALNKQYEDDLTRLYGEYEKKVADFVASRDSLPVTIQERRAQEIGDLEQRIQSFRQVAAQDFQKKQQEKFAPIFEKVSKAIKDVGDENGFTYIFDLSKQAAGIVYYSETNTVDVLPLVKTKLGLK